MISFWRIFWLEFTGFVRSRTLVLLVLASVGWMLGLPFVLEGDGTAEGARELYVNYSLGGVFALLVIALAASATGSLAREREAKRLQLTLVRPVRYTQLVLAKIFAHVALGALVLALACRALVLRVDPGRPCDHVLSPVLPPVRAEAEALYEKYMDDPETPEDIRKMKRETVLSLLENRALDRYVAIRTNETATLKFELGSPAPAPRSLAVRMRFTNQYEMRQDVRGTFAFGDYRGAVSNITQAVIRVPLVAGAQGADLGTGALTFGNRGGSAVMLRPRKDISLLVPADSFGWNLVRSFVVLLAILSFVISLGVFLSAGLGRPVALFVAFVTLAVSEMSPSVVEQYPDSLETGLVDRIGLCITRFAAEVTRPVSSATPLESLAKDECVEPGTVLRFAVADFLAVPLLLALLSALILPRKGEFVV